MKVKEIYKSKFMTAEQIAEKICSDSVICSDVGPSLPETITAAIAERVRRGEVSGLSQHTILDMQDTRCYDPELAGEYSGISWFSGREAREAVQQGYGDFMPACYRDFSRIFEEYVSVDYLILRVSPMDEEGNFSVGCAASVIPELLKKAKIIFVEANSNMPYTPYAPKISVYQIAGVCEANTPLPEIPDAIIDPVSQKIGEIIAERIPDGATFQLGIGAIPGAVGMALRNKKHLGIHTEMLAGSMIDLMECGVVDNSRKPIHTGKTVLAFAVGSRRMYEFLDQNKDVEVYSARYVNDPTVIAKHPKFVSINTAFEVDFFGQVSAESIGNRHFSGTGGQVDFVQGANLSEGGQSFIAFSSTALDGTVSRIQPMLTPGAIVTTTKNDVDMIVTEYGIAKLRGQTLKQRVQNLISVAHPSFREELLFEAKKLNYLL